MDVKIEQIDIEEVKIDQNDIELSIILPCLNEAETLATCIGKAEKFLQSYEVNGEIIVADNGSTDGSQSIAVEMGVRLINIGTKGYGAALMGGIAAARGQFIIMGDSDVSYDFTNLAPFLDKLREGYDLVMGNRFQGGIKPGAMPFLHRYLGNPVLSWIGRLLFKAPIGDFHCGLRGFRKSSIEKLHLQTTGMEFASEMIVKATLFNQHITEVPTVLWPDKRSRPSHLRTWRDGWRHLRFLILYSPDWLFMFPGGILFILGFLLLLALAHGPIQIGRLYFDLHYVVLGSLLALLGTQVISIGIYAKVYSLTSHLRESDALIGWFLKYFDLERGIILGGLVFLVGLSINVTILYQWVRADFGALFRIRDAILAMTLMVLGAQILFSSLFLSILGIKKE
jgi:glycosyltransferase involved in cell wall biosynthesis